MTLTKQRQNCTICRDTMHCAAHSHWTATYADRVHADREFLDMDTATMDFTNLEFAS